MAVSTSTQLTRGVAEDNDISRTLVEGKPVGNLTRDEVLDNISHDLADKHRDVVGSTLLGEHPRLLRRQGNHCPGRGDRLPERALPGPRSWTEDAYPNLIYFNEVGEGNHFAAWQEPEIFTNELRAAFRSLR